MGFKLTLITVTLGIEQPDSGCAVKVNRANPFAISLAEGVNIGVSELAFVNSPGVPEAPLVFVHKILSALFTVTKSGIVKVSPHIIILFCKVVIVGFWLIVITIVSVTGTCRQLAFGNTDIVNVTLEISFDPKI